MVKLTEIIEHHVACHVIGFQGSAAGELAGDKLPRINMHRFRSKVGVRLGLTKFGIWVACRFAKAIVVRKVI